MGDELLAPSEGELSILTWGEAKMRTVEQGVGEEGGPGGNIPTICPS